MPTTASTHEMVVFDPATKAQRTVLILIAQVRDSFDFSAHFRDSTDMLASGRDVATTEADALTAAQVEIRRALGGD